MYHVLHVVSSGLPIFDQFIFKLLIYEEAALPKLWNLAALDYKIYSNGGDACFFICLKVTFYDRILLNKLVDV